MRIVVTLCRTAWCGAILFGAPALAVAADLPESYAVDASGSFCAAFSHPFSQPAITPTMIREGVEEHFNRSVEILGLQSTIYNASPRYIWSNETKFYCGMAIGYFAANEFNDEAVAKCDCFYAQMRHYMQH